MKPMFTFVILAVSAIAILGGWGLLQEGLRRIDAEAAESANICLD